MLIGRDKFNTVITLDWQQKVVDEIITTVCTLSYSSSKGRIHREGRHICTVNEGSNINKLSRRLHAFEKALGNCYSDKRHEEFRKLLNGELPVYVKKKVYRYVKA